MSFVSKSKSPVKVSQTPAEQILVLDTDQSMIQFPYESYFGKLELGNGETLNVCFVEFAPLTLTSKDLKERTDFPLGSITVIEGEVNKSTIDEGGERFTSSTCLNDSLEWNEGFLRKIRLAFIKRLKNVKFYLDKNIEEGVVISKQLRLCFIVQDSLEITAMTVPLLPGYVSNNVEELLSLMGNFNGVKNKQIEELNTKIEDQKKINDGLTFEMSRFVTEANGGEKEMLQKFILLLNSKKEKIRALKEDGKVEDLNEDSDEDYGRINKMTKEEKQKAMDVPEDSFVFDTQLLGTGALDELHTKSIFQATGTQYIATNFLKPIRRGDVSKTSEESKIQRQDSLSDLFE